MGVGYNFVIASGCLFLESHGLNLHPVSNIITLANAAKMKIIGLSNQGYIGEYDIAVSAISVHHYTNEPCSSAVIKLLAQVIQSIKVLSFIRILIID